MINKELKHKKTSDEKEKVAHRFFLPLGLEEHWCLALMNFLILVPLIGWIAPIIFWSDAKSISTRINRQGKYILNWLISSFIYFCIILFCQKLNWNDIMEYSKVTGKKDINLYAMYLEKFFENPLEITTGNVLFILTSILLILGILSPIIGTIKGYNGHTWKYPLSIPFLK